VNGEKLNSQTSDDMLSLARTATISIIKDDKLLDSEGEVCVGWCDTFNSYNK